MKDINTYVLMLELCRRFANFVFDPEPEQDQVLEDLTKTFNMTQGYDDLKLMIDAYKESIESRSEDA